MAYSDEMKRIAIFLFLLSFTALTNSSPQKAPPAGSINAAKILEGNLASTGGLSAHKEVVTFRASGDFGLTLTHPLGNYTFLYKAPKKDVLEVQLISHGMSWTGRRDERQIRRGSVQGAQMINGVGMEIVEQSLLSLLEWDIRGYEKIELVGRAQVDKRWAYAPRFTPRHGDQQVRYYDSETFLLVRMDQVQRFKQANNIPELGYAVTTYFRDSRQYGALKLPHQIAISRDAGDLMFELGDVKTGVEIPDTEFKD